MLPLANVFLFKGPMLNPFLDLTSFSRHFLKSGVSKRTKGWTDQRHIQYYC